jgi:hypothetical protein
MHLFNWWSFTDNNFTGLAPYREFNLIQGNPLALLQNSSWYAHIQPMGSNILGFSQAA